MKRSTIRTNQAWRLTALFCLFITMAGCSDNDNNDNGENPPLSNVASPARNPYLASEHYSITHFNSAQTDAFPYGVKSITKNVDPEQCEGGWSGPVNLMTLSAAKAGYMWGMSSDRVSYYNCSNGGFTKIGEAALPVGKMKTEEQLRKITAKYSTAEDLRDSIVPILGEHPQYAIASGNYVLCDKDNYAYTNAATIVARYRLKNENKPEEGIVLDKQLNIKESVNGVNLLVGVVMTYDGYLAVAYQKGLVIVDRGLTGVKATYTLPENQILSNSIAVDENGGIYIASNNTAANGKGLMQKIVWNGSKLSEDQKDGAWQSEYDGGPEAPCIKMGYGTGSTPTLMGFGKDEDKLVVITDGAQRMKLVAFWRDGIPADAKEKVAGNPRIADQYEVSCGLPEGTQWIQSEQSVVAAGYGAFVVNNITTANNMIHDKIVGVLSLGPIYSAPYGVERLKWNTKENKWETVWSRPDVCSISMIPSVSTASEMVFVNGYSKNDGWEVTGLDWNTGATKHRVVFGDTSRGNGAYAIIQYLENGDLLFNSISGPYRVKL